MKKIWNITENKMSFKISLCGLELKIKKPTHIRKNLIEKFINHNILPNTILIMELNDCHKETAIGYYYYLKKLGYNVEIILRNGDDKVFSRVQDEFNIWDFNLKELKKLMGNPVFKNYERILFNSKLYYHKGEHELSLLFNDLPKGKKDNIYVQHHIDRFNDNPSDKQIVLANPGKLDNVESCIVNPHWFGNVKITSKNKITTFLAIGGLIPQRRNYKLLINAVENLVQDGYTNFKVNVIGKGKLKSIPPQIQDYINILGRVDYSELYNAVEDSDFFLSLLDPESTLHDRYKKNGTSGGFQVVYGFLKPFIIHRTFADIYNFTEENSIIYEENTKLSEAMKNAILMDDSAYSQQIEGIKKLQNQIEKTSYDNLKALMND